MKPHRLSPGIGAVWWLCFYTSPSESLTLSPSRPLSWVPTCTNLKFHHSWLSDYFQVLLKEDLAFRLRSFAQTAWVRCCWGLHAPRSTLCIGNRFPRVAGLRAGPSGGHEGSALVNGFKSLTGEWVCYVESGFVTKVSLAIFCCLSPLSAWHRMKVFTICLHLKFGVCSLQKYE